MTTARVLNVVPTLMCGGTENQFMALGRMLDRARFEVEFACLRRWGPFVDELAAHQVPLTEYRVTTFRSVQALAQQALLARHIRRRRIQIVHAYNFYGNVFAIPPARFVAPVVIASIRDCAPYLTAMQKRVQRYACTLADCILVNAEAVKDWLVAEGYRPSKIAVIRNGVDLNRFEAQNPVWLRRAFGLPDSTPLVAVVSRLTRLKGLEHFLEAAAMIRSRVSDARFLVVGDTSPTDREYLLELQAAAKRLGVDDRVIFTGFRTDVPAVLGSVNVSVMPSLNEALSNVLLESMAAGAPTVATRVGGTPEALVDGTTGLLVPPADTTALAGAILRLLDDQTMAARLGRAAQGRIAEDFSLRRMVRATEDLYAELLSRKSGTRSAAAGHLVAPSALRRDDATSDPDAYAAGVRDEQLVRDGPRSSRTSAPRGAAAMHVDLVTDYRALVDLEPEWNDAVERAAVPHPFLRHEWIRSWWDSFGAKRRLHVLVVRENGRITAIAPLMHETATSYGVPVRRLALIANDHTPRTDFVIPDRPDDGYRAIWNALQDDIDRWDVLQLTQLPRGSATLDAMGALAGAEGLPTGTWPSSDSPYLELAGSWERSWAGLPSKFRGNIRNRLSRLTQLGEPALQILRDKTAIQDACEDAWRLEASGWKQEQRTSIGSDPAVHRFYTLLTDRATERQWLRLLFLTVGGRRIAVSYGACYDERLFLFKTGYDPDYHTCSPFKLLTYFAAQDAFANGVREIDFLGDSEPWKQEWTSAARGHDWLFIFSNTRRARLLHSLKFRMAPELKRWRA